MFTFGSFFIHSDPSRADQSEIKLVATGLQIGNGLTIASLAGLPNLRDVISELLGQDRDAAYSSEGTAEGALVDGAGVANLVVEFAKGATAAEDTIKVEDQAAWSRAKAGGFIDGLVTYGLVPVPPAPPAP